MNGIPITRRAFLKATGALAATLALGGALPAPTNASSLIDPYGGVVPMVFPIRRGVYWLMNNWHVPRIGSVLSFNHQLRPWLRAHDGVDIFALKGTALYACAAGTIIDVPRPRYLYGNTVWIQADDGYRFFYCHLDKVFVRAGQTVGVSTVLGTVGNTGNAATTPAHLHFELHYPAGNSFPCKYCAGHKSVGAINPYRSLVNATPRGW